MATQGSQQAAARRCLTCKERKIKCDGAQPKCQNCQKARRQCRAGHAFELSWPKPRSRRALEGPGGGHNYVVKGGDDYHFVNVLSDHVAAHRLLPYAATSQGTRSILFDREYSDMSYFNLLPMQAPSLYADVERLQTGGPGLMSYFYYEASNSLPQLDSEPAQFRDLLLRMSVQDSSASSKAVLYSLFSLSALRRYGNVQESVHFKGLALQALQEAAKSDGMGHTHVLQHMAAGLLLCRAEISLGDDSGVFWALYICSLRTVCNHAFEGPYFLNNTVDSDASILYRYMHYHDILAEFSLIHWQRPWEILPTIKAKFKGQNVVFKCHENYLDRFAFSSLGDYLQYEIYLLSLILKASKKRPLVRTYRPGGSHPQDLDGLEAELRRVLVQSKEECEDLTTVDEADQKAAAAARLKVQRHLFLVACWIYFQRTCRHLTGPSSKIDALFDDVFALSSDIQRLDVRIAPFSLFLIGAEANTETRRRTFMDFIHHRPEPPAKANAVLVKAVTPMQIDCLISAVWAQDDLHDDSEGYLDYVTKVQYVMTARSVLPALV